MFDDVCNKSQQRQIFAHQFMHVSSNKFYRQNENKWNPQPQLRKTLSNIQNFYKSILWNFALNINETWNDKYFHETFH